MSRPTNPYAVDGKCHNSDAGDLNQECGKPATWIASRGASWGTGFCDECKVHGREARDYDIWHKIKGEPR